MEKDYGLFYKAVRGGLRLFMPSFSVWDQRSSIGKEKDAVVYVSHHQNLFGPITILLWVPEFLRTWMYSVFLEFDTCYRQYVDYTFTKRLGWPTFLAKAAAWPAAWFAVTLTNSGRGIPVYRKSRAVINTLKQTVDALVEGESVLIFPDVEYDDKSPEIKEIYDGFLYIEKYYFRKTGEHVSFVPVYADKKEKEIRIGMPILFGDEENFLAEKKAIAAKIQVELNQLKDLKNTSVSLKERIIK